MSTRLFLLLALTILAGLAVEISRSRFYSTSVCSNSGEILREQEWKIPFTDTTFWTTRSVSDSALSVVIKKYGLDTSHVHTWRFSQGSGNGVICALGDGSHIWGAVSTPYIAQFIDCACGCGETQFAIEWLKILLDPARSNDARLAVGVANMPPGGFANRDQFAKWWSTESSQVADFLNTPVPDLDQDKNP